MRLCLTAQEYPPETAHGGIATQTRAKAHGLAALGHEVTVLSHSPDANRHETRDGTVRVVRLPGYGREFTPRTEESRWVTWSSRVAAGLSELQQSAPFDLVDFPEYGGEAFVFLLDRPEWNRVPVTVQLHGPLAMLAHTIGWPELDSELYRTGTFMEETCVRRADAVYSSSRCSADWCARHYGLESGAVPILHTGVDTAHFRPPEEPGEHAPTVVFVGRLAESKGVLTLVRACAALAGRHPDLRLLLAGPGDERFVDRLRAEAPREGLLELAGFVSREELPALLTRADIFAAPSRYEGGPGFVYLEAMACGLPAIAGAGSGAAEVIVPGDTGLLVPPDDVEALAAQLDGLLSRPDERRAMGRQARDWVVAHADTGQCIRHIEQFFEATIRRHGPGEP